ncbi:MAG: hypothetical protein R6V13_12085, partial [Anaerolineae bacterium]
ENFLKGKKHDSCLKEFAMFKSFYEQIVLAKGFEFVEAEKKIQSIKPPPGEWLTWGLKATCQTFSSGKDDTGDEE